MGGGCNSLRREAWPLAAGPADPPLGRGWAWVRGQLLGLGLAGHWAGSHSLWCLYLLSLFLVSGSFSLNPQLVLLSAIDAPTPRGIGVPGFRIQALSPPGLPHIHPLQGQAPVFRGKDPTQMYAPSLPIEGGRRSSAPVGGGPGGRQGEQSPSSSRWLRLWKRRRLSVSELGGAGIRTC